MALASFACTAALRAPAERRNAPPMERWAEEVAGRPLPPSATRRSAFEALPQGVGFRELLFGVGPPVREDTRGPATAGGVLDVYVWEVEDGGEIHVATPDLDTVEFIELHTPGGKRVRLIGR